MWGLAANLFNRSHSAGLVVRVGWQRSPIGEILRLRTWGSKTIRRNAGRHAATLGSSSVTLIWPRRWNTAQTSCSSHTCSSICPRSQGRLKASWDATNPTTSWRRWQPTNTHEYWRFTTSWPLFDPDFRPCIQLGGYENSWRSSEKRGSDGPSIHPLPCCCNAPNTGFLGFYLLPSVSCAFGKAAWCPAGTTWFRSSNPAPPSNASRQWPRQRVR